MECWALPERICHRPRLSGRRESAHPSRTCGVGLSGGGYREGAGKKGWGGLGLPLLAELGIPKARVAELATVLEPGDALIFDHCLLHRSQPMAPVDGPRVSGEFRVTLRADYLSPESRGNWGKR